MLSLLVAFSLGVIVIVVMMSHCGVHSRLMTSVFVVGVVSVYCHRAANGSLALPFFYAENTVSQ